MHTYAALLRGINVGGKKKVPMSDVERVFATLGAQDVTIYLQTGNVVFRSRIGDEQDLAQTIEQGFADHLGTDLTVLLRAADAIQRIVQSNPFLGSESDLTKLHVTFCADQPEPDRADHLKTMRFDPDEFHLNGREIYLHTPNGYGRTKLSNAFFERTLRVAATTRNWNTVVKLAELTSA
jgi:uncharacterized protein (DUF1697 family)